MTSFGPCGEVRQALAVYLLGAIEPADRAVVDAHLAGCMQCRQELAGLAGLPALLHRIAPAEAAELTAGDSEPDQGATLGALIRRAARTRRHRLRTQLAVAAAAGLIAGGAVAAGLGWAAAGQNASLIKPGPGAGSMATARAADPRTLVRATVRYASAPWGLRLQVRLSGVPAGTDCELSVLSKTGRRLMAGSWTVGGNPAAWYPASTWMPLSAVRDFVISSGGSVLVTVPVPARSAESARFSSERTGRAARGHRYARPGIGTERLP